MGPRYARFFADLLSPRAPERPLSEMSGSARGVGPGQGRGADSPADRIEALAAAFLAGSEAGGRAPITSPGWLDEGTDRVLARELSAETRLVVELGAWLGMSSRYIADHAPNATVISVDHWRGSPEHRSQDQFRAMLPTLYETFLAQCWDYRDRIIPMRMTSLDGLQTVADHGLEPDLVYVDAEHSYEAVTSELELARHLFPLAVLVGDDYNWEGVARAATEFAGRHGLAVERVGDRGWRIVERRGDGAVVSGPTPGRARSVVLVPHLNGIDGECEQGLRRLEEAGIKVVRRGGSSAIDVARNVMISDALHDGFASMMFIDWTSASTRWTSCGCWPDRSPSSAGSTPEGERPWPTTSPTGWSKFRSGPTPGLYPVRFAATGFLRIKATVLRRLIED
ncbi:MAG: class I SAM-dependent methyltransferase [Singulisphaera sp.]